MKINLSDWKAVHSIEDYYNWWRFQEPNIYYEKTDGTLYTLDPCIGLVGHYPSSPKQWTPSFLRTSESKGLKRIYDMYHNIYLTKKIYPRFADLDEGKQFIDQLVKRCENLAAFL